MAFELSYGGIPFCINTDETDWLLRWKLPLPDTHITLPWMNNPLLYLANPLQYPHRPRLSPGCFFYPSGIRWGEFCGLATDDQLKAMLPIAFQGGLPTANNLVIKQCGVTLTLPKWFMLPPHPVAKFGNNVGLHMVTLVDDRYFWQFKSQEQPDLTSSSTWSNVFTWLKNKLGITLTVDSISGSYPGPEPESCINQPMAPAAQVLEAACYNTGLQLSRLYDGTYLAGSTATNLETLAGNLSSNTVYLAGGNAYDLYPETKAAALPKTVIVAFPKFILDGSYYLNSWEDHIPQPINTGEYYTVSVNLDTVISGQKGFEAKKYFVETCKAVYNTAVDSSPSNSTSLNNLANQIASDYYKPLAAATGIDISFPGPRNWTPDGLTDMLLYWQKDRLYTRIYSRPFNSQVEYLSHVGPDGVDTKTCIQIIQDVCCADGTLTKVKRYLRMPGNGVTVTDTFCSSQSSLGACGEE